MKQKKPLTILQKKGLWINFIGIALSLLLNGFAIVVLADGDKTIQTLVRLFAITGTAMIVYAIGGFLIEKPMSMNVWLVQR